MATRELTIVLPEPLAQEVEETGLLQDAEIERLLRTELKRRHARELLELADRLAAQGVPPMSEEEIEVEIDAARSERNGNETSSGVPAYRLPYEQWAKKYDAWLASHRSSNPQVDDSRESIYP